MISGGPLLEDDQLTPAVRDSHGGSYRKRSGGGTATPMNSGKDRLLGKPCLPNQARDGATGGGEDVVSKGHTFKGKKVFTDVKRRIPDKGKENVYHWYMERTKPLDPWPERPHFRDLLDIWRIIPACAGKRHSPRSQTNHRP